MRLKKPIVKLKQRDRFISGRMIDEKTIKKLNRVKITAKDVRAKK